MMRVPASAGSSCAVRASSASPTVRPVDCLPSAIARKDVSAEPGTSGSMAMVVIMDSLPEYYSKTLLRESRHLDHYLALAASIGYLGGHIFFFAVDILDLQEEDAAMTIRQIVAKTYRLAAEWK